MPAISLVSADNLLDAAEEFAAEPKRTPRSPRKALIPEASHAALSRALKGFAGRVRQSSIYRISLYGKVPDAIHVHPFDSRTARLEDADSYFRGRFRFAGELLEIRQGSIFDLKMPSASYAAALHGFEWLRHLKFAGSEHARDFASKLTQHWFNRYANYALPAWQPEIIARRFFNLFCHGAFFLAAEDLPWRPRLFRSLRDQTRMLARTLQETPDGLPRFDAAAALALAGVCLEDEAYAVVGLRRLTAEVGRQILPDGGHVSRSPEALLDAFRTLCMVQDALDETRRKVPELRVALDRMAPMLRFFRFSDGGLAPFNGGAECDPKELELLLQREEMSGRPFGHAPYSGYQRLAAGRSVVLLDVGAAPPGPFSLKAHAGFLALQMSVGHHRLIVNCGAAPADHPRWDKALRSTAAHSTVAIADTSPGKILDGNLASLFGARFESAPIEVETRRGTSGRGHYVEANHDGYWERFGIVHQRRMTLSSRGNSLAGADRLTPSESKRRKRRQEPVPYTIRFHIHPDVRVSLAQDLRSALLKLPNGEGWRFRWGGGALSIEESVYLGTSVARRAEQLVITGEVADQPVECAWSLEQVAPD
jgi:uncharacterized heparinase superfamily protein